MILAAHGLALVSVLSLVAAPYAADTDSLERRFANPPASTRILNMTHTLPDAPEKQQELLDSLSARGFGGMAVNVSVKDGYIENEANWTAFVQTVRLARDRGLALWLYDEKGYPSGTAGGITLRRNPEWEAAGLYCADTVANGGQVALELPPGALLYAAAFPEENGNADLEKQIDLKPHAADGKFLWETPPGTWRIVAITQDRLFEGTHATENLFADQPYINLLMAPPTARFIEVTHAAYAQRLGGQLGRFFISTFTDEPSLMSVFMQKKPWRVVPWAPDFANEFRIRRGYDIGPLLPALFLESIPGGHLARYDFWQTVAELTAENFFGRIQTWCASHGILSGGHLLSEESLLSHVPFYGDFFRCARRLDAPGIDVLTSIPDQVPWYIARLISSAADLEGKSMTMSETSDHAQRWRGPGDTRPVYEVAEAEIRGTINRQLVNGITTFTSYYSFSGMDDEQLRRLNTWVGRCATAMRGGRQVADIAVMYPVQSVWPKFLPSHRWMDEAPQSAKVIEEIYRKTSDVLFKAIRDFTYVDAQTLAEGRSDAATFRYRDLSWRVLLLPGVDTLPQAAWDSVAAFWRNGGIVIAAGALPANNEKEFPASSVQAMAAGLFDAGPETANRNAAGGAAVFLPPGKESLIPGLLDQMLERDFVCEPADAPLRYTHRRIDGREMFLVINDSGRPWEGLVSVGAEGPGQRFDPGSGEITPEPSADRIPLHIDAYGAMLFRFHQGRMPKRL